MTSLCSVRQKCLATCAFILHPVFCLPAAKMIGDKPNPMTLKSVAELMLITGLKIPGHRARRHFASSNSIDLVADCTPDIVRSAHLLLQALLMETMVCAFAHYYHINGQ